MINRSDCVSVYDRLSMLTLVLVCGSATLALGTVRPDTGVTFRSADAGLQRLFDAAQAKTAANSVQFTPSMKVLVEGGGYGNAWIETQPLGGEMYAKRNLEVALNNQLIFMLSQRSDGRLPGMVISTDKAIKMMPKEVPEAMVWMPKARILADFEMFQGYCFPTPAWRMYFWIGKDEDYLRRLYTALKAHDAYGPMMLAALEYLSRMHGIHLDVVEGRVWWSSLDDHDSVYTQRWGEHTWSMSTQDGRFTARLNARDLFSCTTGVRVVTDLGGKVIELVGIAPAAQSVVLQIGHARYTVTIRPNDVYGVADGKLTPYRSAPFDYPYRQGGQ